MSASDPNFQIETQGLRESATLIRLTGELDLAAVDHFGDAIERVSDESDIVVVDAAGVDFIDSTGLRSLLIGKATVESGGGSLCIIPSDALRRLLAVSGITDEVDLADSVDDAIEAMGRRHAR